MADCIRNMERKMKKNDLGLTGPEVHAMARSICESMVIKNKADSNKLERRILKIKKGIREKYPDWSEDKITTSAFKICNSELK